MLKTKILFNSVISDAKKGSCFASMDLKDMFLKTIMKTPEYMQVHIKYFPADIIKKYNLKPLISNNHIYVKIKKGMYGLKQAAVLVFYQLSDLLKAEGYYQIPSSLRMWKYASQNIIFNLCVDDFGIKYYNKEDVHHLIQTVQKIYPKHES